MATSACAMMPQQHPLASTTGTLRIWFSSITATISSKVVSAVTATTGWVIASSALTVLGFFPLATTRHTMSRSVTTPMSRFEASTTGISPQSAWTIMLATSLRLVSGPQHCGSGVITSFASFDIKVGDANCRPSTSGQHGQSGRPDGDAQLTAFAGPHLIVDVILVPAGHLHARGA